MKLYTTLQGHWTGTQADARKLAKQHSICDVFEVPVDKKGLLGFLNAWQVGRHEATSDEEPATSDKESAPVVEVEETKIVGETREQYMRKWRQEQADLGAEFNVRIAIEDALWESPLHDLAGYTSVVISRLAECIHVEKTEGVVKMRKLREGES
jgi:hypothetical protein